MKRIHLDDNAIGEAGTRYLADAIKSNRVIVHLRTIFSRFTISHVSFEGLDRA